MPAAALEFAYGVGDRVEVCAISCVGFVDSMSYDQMGDMYRVVYWDNAECSVVWMYPWELRPGPPEE